VPIFSTTQIGLLEYVEQDVVEFAEGLPAFENERRFVVTECPENRPLIYLQSLQSPHLLFLTLRPRQIVPDYAPQIPPEELTLLGLAADRQPEEGREVALLAILSIETGGRVSANLMAPIVINLHSRQARQVIQTGTQYSHQHTLRLTGGTC